MAIKMLDPGQGQGDHEFKTEIALLSVYKHENIVSLLGFCDEDGQKILVYKDERNGSLDKHLNRADLTWIQRLQICLDAARGLQYLHNDVEPHLRILHRDIKSSNILLGENLKAKISDFGLSKVGPANIESTFLISNPCGTFGYIDPEYMTTGYLTQKSDIYSFGVVLFEVLCGRLARVTAYRDERQFLTNLITIHWRRNSLEEIIYHDLKGQISKASFLTFSSIAYQCLMNGNERPTMKKVVEQLDKALDDELHLHDQMQQKIRASQDQQRLSLSPYNNSTGGIQLESNYDVSKYTPINGQMNQSQENDNLTKFESRPVSQNIEHVYDNSRVNNRFQDGTDNNYFQSPSVNDGDDSFALEDGPGIEGFQIIGDAKPGGKLLGCGFPVRGTSLCMFQWVRHLQDGTREYIEGATNPEYVVTADDVDKLIAVECIPMDDQGRQGEIVRLFANEQNKITCDPEMQQEIDAYMSAGQASFSVLLLLDSSENWEQTTFTLRRSNYQIKINRMQDIFIDEKYSSVLSIKIPSGLTSQFVLTRLNGSSHPFTFHDVRMRDTFVLTMRMFQSKALDERRKTKA